jgi:amino acid transporter
VTETGKAADQGLFARDATGLVREISAPLAVFFNLANAPVGTVLVFSVVIGFGLFAGGNILLGILLSIIGSIPVLTYYAFLTASMPRTGGDYVFTTRFIHPAIGFAANLGFVANNLLGAGVVAVFVGTLGVSPAFSILAKLTGSNAMSQIATWSASPIGSLVLAAISLTVLAALAITGTALTLRVTAVLWIVGLIAILLMFAVLASTSNDSFQKIFNDYVSAQAGSRQNWYQQMITVAAANGYAERDPLLMLWGLLAVGMFGSGWFFWSTYLSGEVKSARSVQRQLRIMLGAQLINGALYLVGTALFIHTFGYTFLGSITYLLLNAPSKVPFFTGSGAHVVLFTGLAAPTVIAVVFCVTFIAWAWLLLPAYFYATIRCAFAWSLDRIIPAKISEVSPRTHTPILLTALVWLISLGCAAFAAYSSTIFTLYAFTFVGTGIYTMLVAGIAAILFPYRSRHTYNASPIAKYRILGAPAIVVAGVIGVIYTIIWCAAYFYFPEFGLHSNDSLLLYVFGGIFVGGLVIYYVSLWVRKSQGIPMDKAFAEIPPE